MDPWKGTKPYAADIYSPFNSVPYTLKKWIIVNTYAGTNTITVKIIRGTAESIICKGDFDELDKIIEDGPVELTSADKIVIISTQKLDYNFSFS